MLTFQQLREANVTRCENDINHKITDWSPCDWATAMAGECGEACNVVKKLRRMKETLEDLWTEYKFKQDFESYEDGVKELGKELADMICYADLLAVRMGIDLEKAVVDKFNEISDRYNSSIKLG